MGNEGGFAKLLRNFKVSRFLIMKVHYATQFTQANASTIFLNSAFFPMHTEERI